MEITQYLPAIALIGRQTELSDITQLLAAPGCRLLTLVGPGGIGKTRLALEAARFFVEGGDPKVSAKGFRFGNGVYLVFLQPLSSPDFMVNAIAEAVDFPCCAGDDPAGQLLDYLRDKTLLLVLDNFEHVLAAAGLVSDILATAAGVKIIVTSRERLNLHEEWVYEVRGLAFPTHETENDIETYGAVQLFVQNARRVQSGFMLTPAQYPAILRICRLVDGNPLGIELAAAWVRVLPCEAIARELEHSLDILETPFRNLPSRHRTIRAAFEPTWERLSEDERRVFKRLSLFRGGFSRESAQAVAGATLHSLTALLDKSLLRVSADGRYGLHELLRQYSEEKLHESVADVEQVQALFCRYYAAFLRDRWQALKGARAKEALEELDLELENIRAFWQLAINRQAFAEMQAAADSLWLFYDTRSRYQEGQRLFAQAATSLAQAASHRPLRAKLLAGQGAFCSSMGLHAQGKTLLEESRQLLAELNAPADLALVLLELGRVTCYEGDYTQAQHYFEESIALCRAIDDPLGQARALDWVANIHCKAGDFQKAKEACEQGIALFRQAGSRWGLAIGYKTLCTFLMRLGDYEAARGYGREALALYREIGVPWGIALSLIYLAEVAYQLAEYPEAQQLALQSLSISVDLQLGNFYVLPALVLMAKLLLHRGQAEQAMELLSPALGPAAQGGLAAHTVPQLLDRLEAQVAQKLFATAEPGQMRDFYAKARAILSAFSQTPQARAAVPAPVAHEALADPLTGREFEILCLVAEGLSNREIAGRLFLSPGTVKWYVNQIYGKLHVRGRTQAVARARDLHLLA